MTPKLEATDLAYERDETRIFADVSFAVDSGEWVGVTGPSGAGKSSLLRLLNRLDEPTAGTVYLDGTDYRELSPSALRQRVALVAQRPALRPGTVVENVTVGPRLRAESVNRDHVDDVLDRLGLRELADRDVDVLSGGEAQRVALARTLVNDPEVLLLDEPTANLDPETTDRVESLVVDIVRERALTVLLVTHDERQADRLTDRRLRMSAGRLTGEHVSETHS